MIQIRKQRRSRHSYSIPKSITCSVQKQHPILSTIYNTYKVKLLNLKSQTYVPPPFHIYITLRKHSSNSHPQNIKHQLTIDTNHQKFSKKNGRIDTISDACGEETQPSQQLPLPLHRLHLPPPPPGWGCGGGLLPPPDQVRVSATHG